MKSLNDDPLTLKKAVLLCFYALGLRFAAEMFLYLLKASFGLLPEIVFLGVVLLIAKGMSKDELRRIFIWRNVPLPVFAGILVMFYGMDILLLELSNFLQMVLPVPDGFFSDRFYIPGNVFLVIVTGALFPGFTEEVFFRGVIARRFFRAYSPRKAILLSAMLFGLMHLNPWQAVNAFCAGIFLGWLYWRYKSIWLCMFIHAYHNILVTFMPVPLVSVENRYSYHELWHHPLWFDILGLLLFSLGLVIVRFTYPFKISASRR